MSLRNIPIISLFSMLLASTTGFAAQFCHHRVQPTTPDSRFEVSGSEVKDLQTNLIWQRCTVGQKWDGSACSGSGTVHTWSGALALAAGGWRLPNLAELNSIVETACANPAINLTVFPNTTSHGYWSSSPDANNTSRAWNVVFSYGHEGNDLHSYSNAIGYKYRDFYVRLVRAGQ